MGRSKLPAVLKPITPYIKRADELTKKGDGKSALMAYFCRAYAVELGIALNDGAAPPEVGAALAALMDRLEADGLGEQSWPRGGGACGPSSPA